jgi:glycosyltransferase involved in cell wall biosynthesis
MVNTRKSAPLVSIVLPTYNRANLLGRALRSIINQTYSNFEVIVVDDCSNDATEHVVKSFRDERMRYIRNERNMGAVLSRNTGITAGRGKYIAFQDSDDEWLSTKLEKQMNAFNFGTPDLGVVYTSFWLIDKGKKVFVPRSDLKHTEGKIHSDLLWENFVTTPTAVVRKECFEKVGMFENLPRLQDWALWLRISKDYRFEHIKEPLLNAYRQPDSISRNINAFIVARKYILHKYFEEISKKSKLLGKHYFEIGVFLCLSGDIEAGRKYFQKAIRAHPFDAKLLLSFLASFFGLTIYTKLAVLYLRTKT